jgi:hypothetical protein
VDTFERGKSGEPLIRFFRLYPEARLPKRADRSAGGTIPTRAFRYCEAIASASAFGWYVFPPMNFSLLWDGNSVLWTYDEAEHWYPLGSAQLPGFSDYFDKHAPRDVKSFALPFLNAFVEGDIVQIWTGLMARTAPDWSLLIRPVANLPRSRGYELYEGIIETDRWFGPLFTNIRLTKTDVPIEFRSEIPLLQVQAVPRHVYAAATLDAFDTVPEIADFTAADWDRYRETVVKPSSMPDRPRGQYAVGVRKRSDAACPFGHAKGDGEKPGATTSVAPPVKETRERRSRRASAS